MSFPDDRLKQLKELIATLDAFYHIYGRDLVARLEAAEALYGYVTPQDKFRDVTEAYLVQEWRKAAGK